MRAIYSETRFQFFGLRFCVMTAPLAERSEAEASRFPFLKASSKMPPVPLDATLGYFTAALRRAPPRRPFGPPCRRVRRFACRVLGVGVVLLGCSGLRHGQGHSSHMGNPSENRALRCFHWQTVLQKPDHMPALVRDSGQRSRAVQACSARVAYGYLSLCRCLCGDGIGGHIAHSVNNVACPGDLVKAGCGNP